MARTVTISIGEELQDFAQSLVDSGQYGSISEVIRESLRSLQENRAGAKLTLLRQLIDEGENSGPPVAIDADTFRERVTSKRVDAK